MDNICVAVQGTVSIDVKEYRALLMSQAYLNVIMEAKEDEKSYIVDNVVEVVSRLVNPVITDCKPGSGDEEGTTGA